MENHSRQRGSDFSDGGLTPAQHAENHLRFIHWADNEIDRCWPWLEKALERGLPEGLVTHTKDDIKRIVFAGQADLYTTENGVMIVTYTQYPQCKIATVWLMGGNFEEVMAAHEENGTRVAIRKGATAVYVQGRPGWVRRLQPRGYQECQRIAVKILAPEPEITRA